MTSDRDRDVLFKPFPKQEIFLSCEYDEVLFGGSRGGGKTAALIIDAALKARRWHIDRGDGGYEVVVERRSVDYPEYRALILRRTFQDLYMNFKPEADKIYTHLGAKWREKKQAYVFPSGAMIHLGYCDSYANLDKYIGGNFHYLGIEEVNQFHESWVRELGGSIRSVNPELKPFKRYTTNPGGVGHLWLKKKFVDSCPTVSGGEKYSDRYGIYYKDRYPGSAYIDENGNSVWYVPAGVFDNPAIMDNNPEYVQVLKGLDPIKRKMWLDGDWDMQGGTFFGEWNQLHHVIPRGDFALDISKHRIYRCIDYGSTNPYACLFVAVDTEGFVTVFDELYERNVVPSGQARQIMETTARHGLDEGDVWLTVVDPAMKIKSNEYAGSMRSVLDIYIDEGMRNVHLGDNSRIPGWVMFKEYLHVPDYVEGGRNEPYLRFTDNCYNSIETIPTLVMSRNNPDDLDTTGEDHLADALRYLLVFLQKPHGRVREPEMKKWQKELMRKSKKDKSMRRRLPWTA